jgi:hypothetical protein
MSTDNSWFVQSFFSKWDSVDGTEMRLQAGRFEVQILAGARGFLFCKIIHTGSVIHQAFYSIATRILSFG